MQWVKGEIKVAKEVKGIYARTQADLFSAWYFPTGRPSSKVYKEISDKWTEDMKNENYLNNENDWQDS